MNAGAGPNGLILVNRGIVEYAANEEEVCMVIAHEMGHQAANHRATSAAQPGGWRFDRRRSPGRRRSRGIERQLRECPSRPLRRESGRESWRCDRRDILLERAGAGGGLPGGADPVPRRRRSRQGARLSGQAGKGVGPAGKRACWTRTRQAPSASPVGIGRSRKFGRRTDGCRGGPPERPPAGLAIRRGTRRRAAVRRPTRHSMRRATCSRLDATSCSA